MRVAERADRQAIDVLESALQWSRNLRVAESGAASSHFLLNASLQWSRNLRVAESRQSGRPRGTCDASMEPQLEGCGKRRGGPPAEVERLASMEPQLEGCGKAPA